MHCLHSIHLYIIIFDLSQRKKNKYLCKEMFTYFKQIFFIWKLFLFIFYQERWLKEIGGKNFSVKGKRRNWVEVFFGLYLIGRKNPLKRHNTMLKQKNINFCILVLIKNPHFHDQAWCNIVQIWPYLAFISSYLQLIISS